MDVVEDAVLRIRAWAAEQHLGEPIHLTRRREAAWILCEHIDKLQAELAEARKAIEALRDYYAWSMNSGNGMDSDIEGYATREYFTGAEIAAGDVAGDAVEEALARLDRQKPTKREG